jgi:hypothetical protein
MPACTTRRNASLRLLPKPKEAALNPSCPISEREKRYFAPSIGAGTGAGVESGAGAGAGVDSTGGVTGAVGALGVSVSVVIVVIFLVARKKGR